MLTPTKIRRNGAKNQSTSNAPGISTIPITIIANVSNRYSIRVHQVPEVDWGFPLSRPSRVVYEFPSTTGCSPSLKLNLRKLPAHT